MKEGEFLVKYIRKLTISFFVIISLVITLKIVSSFIQFTTEKREFEQNYQKS